MEQYQYSTVKENKELSNIPQQVDPYSYNSEVFEKEINNHNKASLPRIGIDCFANSTE